MDGERGRERKREEEEKESDGDDYREHLAEGEKGTTFACFQGLRGVFFSLRARSASWSLHTNRRKTISSSEKGVSAGRKAASATADVLMMAHALLLSFFLVISRSPPLSSLVRIQQQQQPTTSGQEAPLQAHAWRQGAGLYRGAEGEF